MKKHFLPALGWALLAYILTIIVISASATLLIMFNTNSNQTIHFFGLPLYNLHSDNHGFSIENLIGSIIIPVFAGGLTFITTLLSRKNT